MTEKLEHRQAIVDNYERIIKALPKNKDQITMFAEDPLLEWAIKPDDVIESILLLEEERRVLTYVSSVDYIKKNSLMSLVLNIKRLSDVSINDFKAKATGICVGMRSDVKFNKVFYYGIFADSYRKVEILISLSIFNSLQVGQMYLLNYKQKSLNGKDIKYYLIKLFLITRKTTGLLLKGKTLKFEVLKKNNDYKQAKEFAMYISSIRNDNGIEVIISLEEKILKIKVLMSEEIFRHLVDYFNIKVTLNG